MPSYGSGLAEFCSVQSRLELEENSPPL